MGPLRGQQEWQMIEFFSGIGRISTLAAKTGLVVASYEIDQGFVPERKPHHCHPPRNSMDLNGESGFAFLGMVWPINCFSS